MPRAAARRFSIVTSSTSNYAEGLLASRELSKAARAEAPIQVALDLLRPTQVAVGMRSVAAKREKVIRRAERRDKIARFLDRRPIPSVLGPEGHLYIIDHHHLGLALWQAEVDAAVVRIVDDLSALPKPMFWTRMEEAGRLYPYDEAGRRVRPSRLPAALPALREDPFRDLAWSVREAGGFKKSREPYAEFRWAAYFREHIPARTLARNYELAVKTALRLCRVREAKGLPGFIDRR